jgi:D-arabinose 1-dehydrogenase-like Zn-dependent alcohol dehydrogenase
MSWREPVFTNEIKMANISKKNSVLLIGSGIFPSEAIQIAKETGAIVTGIDNSINAVKLSKKYLKENNISHNVKIEYADGSDFSVHNFDIIFIAINVYPINSVLINLSNQVSIGTKILCKSIKHDIPVVLRNEGLDSIFDVVGHLKNTRTQSYLLVKKQ